MAARDEAAENGVPSDEEPDPEDRGVSPAPAGYSLYGLAADEWGGHNLPSPDAVAAARAVARMPSVVAAASGVDDPTTWVSFGGFGAKPLPSEHGAQHGAQPRPLTRPDSMSAMGPILIQADSAGNDGEGSASGRPKTARGAPGADPFYYVSPSPTRDKGVQRMTFGGGEEGENVRGEYYDDEDDEDDEEDDEDDDEDDEGEENDDEDEEPVPAPTCMELIHGFRSRPAVSLAESPCEELPAPREELPARPKTARGGPGSDPLG